MRLFGFLLFVATLFASGCGTPHHATHNTSTLSIEEKYAQLLKVDKEAITNKKLYAFIDDWYKTPYQYGGKTKKGIDCSGFTSVLLKEIYDKEVSGSSASIYNQCQKVKKVELSEGDLLFFKIDSKDISHVGIYLQNNKFVHATTKAGVRIDDLNDEYYKKYFIGGSKVR